MWGNSKKKPKQSVKIDSLIGRNTEIRGDVIFNGGLHVDGLIKGNVMSEEGSSSVLTLSERGIVEGEVKVSNVVLNGTIIGDVHAYEHIELAADARVNGNVYYTLIEMAMGAEVNGNLVHRAESQAVVSIKENTHTDNGAESADISKS